MKPANNVIEPFFDSDEYVDYMTNFSILKRISVGFYSWAGDAVPDEVHYNGKHDFLTDSQFQGENEINYFRKSSADLVSFIQTDGWLCLVRFRKILRLLNLISDYEETIESMSKAAGFELDSWGKVLEKTHHQKCRCAPCFALREVKRQIEKKKINGIDIINSVIQHMRRCVYRVFTAGIDRIFETFCSRRFFVVWFILPEEFDAHYRDEEFERLCSVIINDIVAVEPFISIANFKRTLFELYDGASDLASSILQKFAVILRSKKMFYTTAMNFVMFFIDSFNMVIRMLQWLENKFKVFNHMAVDHSDPNFEDKFDFKTVILNALSELVYSLPEVKNRRLVSLEIIAATQRLNKSYFGPNIETLYKYMDYIDTTILEATLVYKKARFPFELPKYNVPKDNVIESALYINPFRDDQFDTPQVFHCYWNRRFVIERLQTPWKSWCNSKTKVLLRLSVENPNDRSRKLGVNVFVADEKPAAADDKTRDQYFEMYESRLDQLVDFFDVLRQEVIDYYKSGSMIFRPPIKFNRGTGRCEKTKQASKVRPSQKARSNKISLPVKLRRPDKRSRHLRDYRMSVLTSLVEKHRKSKKPSTIQSLEQLLTFAVKTGVEGSGLLDGIPDEPKDVYVAITCVDTKRRARTEKEFSLNDLMSFIVYWYSKHGCITDHEKTIMNRRKYEAGKTRVKQNPTFFQKPEESSSSSSDKVLLELVDPLELEQAFGLGKKTTSGKPLTEEELQELELERTFLMNDVPHQQAFAKLTSSGFCVTRRGEILFAEGTSMVSADSECRKTTDSNAKRKCWAGCGKIPELRNRMQKTLEEYRCELGMPGKPHHDDKVGGEGSKSQSSSTSVKAQCTTKSQVTVKLEQVVKTQPATKAQIVVKPVPAPEATVNIHVTKDVDVDELVQMIEGTHIKTSDPKKIAKKARQKEKKEQERQRVADEVAKEEAARLAEEQRRLDEERKKEEAERRKREDEERRRQEHLARKQKESAELKKEEQRKKREELERRKADEKKLKKDAKKQRREQRRNDEHDDSPDPIREKASPPLVHLESASIKTEVKKGKHDTGHKASSSSSSSLSSVSQQLASANTALAEKEFGRIKHEKEQRKREEEEARRLEQLEAQERAQANKKNKKKKKKNKSFSESTRDSFGGAVGLTPPLPADNHHVEPKPAPVGQPLLELLSSASAHSKDAQGRVQGDEKSNLVTIKKHMDSSVTISMKGKEGESDLVYTLMNGQVYPTSMDGRLRQEESLPLQHTGFPKPEARPSPGITMASNESHHYMTPVKTMTYPATPHFPVENSSSAEIDLSQLKLPPGITITKVPQSQSGVRSEEVNGMILQEQNLTKMSQAPSVTEYQRPTAYGMTVNNTYNPNVMVVDSRCSSIESPVIGVRPSEMAYGANGTRPSSEASITSDRPSSGLDSLCMNGGSAPYAARNAYHNADVLTCRVPMPMSSPFTAASRNETPSPAWQQDLNTNFSAIPGMISGNHMNRPDHRPGLWSSSPASPVGFPPGNAVSETYMRAQDQQFIRPHIRGYPQPIGKRSSPSSSNGDGCVPAKPVQVKPVGTPPSIGLNYSPAPTAPGNPGVLPKIPAVLGTHGFHPLLDQDATQSKQNDDWTLWNNMTDRFSPDMGLSAYDSRYRGSQHNGDSMMTFDGASFRNNREKPVVQRGECPYGPIGSNITRRSAINPSNGLSQNGKGTDHSGNVVDSPFWSYSNRNPL